MVNNTLIESVSRVANATRNKESWILSPEDIKQYAYRPYNFTLLEADSLDVGTTTAGMVRTDLQLGGQYNISQSAVNGIGSLMYTTFSNGASKNQAEGRTVPGINGFYFESVYPTDGHGEFIPAMYRPLAMQPLWASTNLPDTFGTIAVSMSNALRAGSDNKTTQVGDRGTSVVKFRIEWPWIALPSMVVIASIVQLALSMRSSGRQIPLWKASTLAVLSRSRHIHGLLDDASTVKDMQQAARVRKLNLLEDDAETKSLASSAESPSEP